MHPYEAMFILKSGLGDDGVNGFIERLGGLLGESGAELGDSGQMVDKKGTVAATAEGWKTRRLTYPIKGQREGYYAVMTFTGPPACLSALDRAVRFNEDVIRYIVLRTDDA